MATNHVQRGHIIDLTAAAVVASGDIVVVNSTSNVVAIALTGAAIGDVYSAQLNEVWEAPAASADVIAIGDKLYFDAGASELTISAAGNTYAGYAFNAKPALTLLVKFQLNGHTE